MKLGPDEVLTCPACGGFARRVTVLSGSTRGERRYTDGRIDRPMLPHPPAIAKCPACAACFWLRRARVVGTVDLDWSAPRDESPACWRAAERVRLPDEQDYYDALFRGLARTPGEERVARTEAWWRSNDRVRGAVASQAMPPAASAERDANLHALLRLFDEADPEDRIMKAEVLRELSRFAEADALLAGEFPPELREAAVRIRALCRARDPMLREL